MIVIHFKIIFILLVTCVYFVYIIISNKQLDDTFKTNNSYLTILSERSTNFNNMILFYRETISSLTSKITIGESSKFENLYKDDNLTNLDLFQLYYNKTISIERNIILLPQD